MNLTRPGKTTDVEYAVDVESVAGHVGIMSNRATKAHFESKRTDATDLAETADMLALVLRGALQVACWGVGSKAVLQSCPGARNGQVQQTEAENTGRERNFEEDAGLNSADPTTL